MSELSEKFWKENGWKTLMEMIKFNEEPDSTGAFAFVLRNRTELSKEAWDKVKDLFEYDEICDEYYTDKTFEVIERLKDTEWKEEAEICKKLANKIRDHSEIYQILPELRKLGFEEVKK